MTELDHVIIGKANRRLINRHDAGRPADAANAHDDPALSASATLKPQEQIQIIRSAIGRPVPNAPPIIKANAESKFGSTWTPCLDTTLLHRAPTGIARRPMMNDKKTCVGTSL